MLVFKEGGLISVGTWRRKMDRVASGEVLRRFACFMFLAFSNLSFPTAYPIPNYCILSLECCLPLPGYQTAASKVMAGPRPDTCDIRCGFPPPITK